MDKFDSVPSYNPEDEYESIDGTGKADFPQNADTAQKTEPENDMPKMSTDFASFFERPASLSAADSSAPEQISSQKDATDTTPAAQSPQPINTAPKIPPQPQYGTQAQYVQYQPSANPQPTFKASPAYTQAPTYPYQQAQPNYQQGYPVQAAPKMPSVNQQYAQAYQQAYPQLQYTQPQPQYTQPQPQYQQATSNPYQQNFAPQQNPAAYNQPIKQPKNPPTSTGTKTYLIILCAVLVALAVGFGIYVAGTVNRGSTEPASSNGNDFYNEYYGNNSSSVYDEQSTEITLAEDNGDSQKRDDDNPASVGTPDESAKNITLKALPEDKDDSKYTTQSAYKAVSNSVVTINCYEGEISDNVSDKKSGGSGTIISKDGYIITNAHVISNSKMYAVKVVLNNGDEYQAAVVGYDTWTDLAVLKINADDLSPVTFGDSELVNVGDDVIAIGSPGGEKFQNSLTKGIVSAVDREVSINKYVKYIQSDAVINPGNSGGPLCNIYGQVIGITTLKTVATYYEGMSFSIPSETVEEIVGDLIHYGYVKGRCRIGLSGTAVSREESLYYGYPAGIFVSSVDENGPLAGSGIQKGDIITEIDGEEITSFQDVYNVLANHKSGDKVTVKYQRTSSLNIIE